jgi:hypothetical protein
VTSPWFRLRRMADETARGNPTVDYTETLFDSLEDEWKYSDKDKYKSHLLEQYKLYLEMADRISSRRQAANSYFLSVNTALLGFVGYLTTKEPVEYLWLLGIAGLALSYSWQRLILSYQNLNTAKFNVVHHIEKRLPISPYNAEWDALGRGKNEKLYKPFTDVERNVPWVFVLLHGFVILRAVHWKAAWDWVMSFAGTG